MAKPHPPASVRDSNPGFTLIEIVLALGVFVVAFVSIMALLPAGLNNLTVAGNTALRSQVVRSVTTELRQTPFSKLNANATTSRTFHFTNEGLPAEKDTPEAVVTANVEKLEFEVPLNDGALTRLARATLIIRQHGRELARSIVYLPDTGT